MSRKKKAPQQCRACPKVTDEIHGHGLCHTCYQRDMRQRERALLGTLPGLMTPEEAHERRMRIAAQMFADGANLATVVQRLGDHRDFYALSAKYKHERDGYLPLGPPVLGCS